MKLSELLDYIQESDEDDERYEHYCKMYGVDK